MTVQNTELGLIARLPDVQAGRVGDCAVAEEAERGVAVQDTEMGVVTWLPDAQTGRDGDGAAAEEAERGVAVQDAELGVIAGCLMPKRGGTGAVQRRKKPS